ncbi:MAG: WD40 repeat domain-containing protein [Oscillospiraceae bacterium]|nr:WD40 repeat domain-containing protein [Oscillospiraceae bacterium]
MRKHQQRQILDILQTLYSAQSAGLYADCQEGAIGVGEYIESIMGEGTQTVTLLEEYCELLFKASGGELSERPEKQLRKKLILIENSVKNELKPTKIEAVFLSYKASMSDSIESIYLAAKDDPACDAYWIPIPYVERGADGRADKTIFEGSKFYPDYIECTDWQTYDIEARRPDVIFTFNPYDAGNYVTSVHPAFYCERLRGLTDLLVYVPYFVATGDHVEEHFCTVAGCVYAHKVIVQSEAVRDRYVRVFREAYGDSLGKPEDKFIALGSPKFDKVINSKREDFKLPEAWARLITPQGGENKKVIFYNTSVGSLLAGNERYLKKLRSVLDTFRGRDDVVLWWRPHPLNEATYASMRPQLAEEYKNIVKEYRAEGWGIYDDTPDLHRALAWTDAYYGDMSSLVAMYEVTGKPVMMSNVDLLLHKTSCIAIAFENQYYDGSDFWFIPRNMNALFKFSEYDWQTKYIGAIPNTTFFAEPIFAKIVEYDGKLYFAPSCADYIGVYDKKNDSFETLCFADLGSARNNKFSFAYVYGNNIFFCGFTYPAIIRLDTTTGALSHYSDYVPKVSSLDTNNKKLFFDAGCADGNKIYLPVYSANAVVAFDMDTYKSTVIEIPSKNNGYDDICFDGDYFWIASSHSEGTVIKWHPEKGATEIEIPNEWAIGDYWSVNCVNGYAWFLPCYGDAAFKINTITNEVEIAEPFIHPCRPKANEKDKTFAYYFRKSVVNNTIYAHTGTGNTHISYNTATGDLRETKIIINDEDREKILFDTVLSHRGNNSPNSMSDCMFRETTAFSLDDFMNQLPNDQMKTSKKINEMQAEGCRKGIANENGTAGQKIYEEFRKVALI